MNYSSKKKFPKKNSSRNFQSNAKKKIAYSEFFSGSTTTSSETEKPKKTILVQNNLKILGEKIERNEKNLKFYTSIFKLEPNQKNIPLPSFL